MSRLYKLFNIKSGLLLALCSLAVLATGCTDDKQNPAISANVEEMFVGSAATSIPVTVYSNTSWTATSDASWLKVSQSSGRGTTDIQLLVEASKDIKRVATVQIKTAKGPEQTIKITQYGPSHTEFRISPKELTLGPKASTGNSFVVSTEHKDATVTAVAADGSEWIRNIASQTTVDGYKTVRFTFNADENTDAYERVGYIEVTVEFGRRTYTETVKVIQNGLGTPAVSAMTNVYMAHNHTKHTQNIWVEGGDQTNVTYTVNISAAHSGTGTESVSWISDASIVDGVLEVNTLPNTLDEVREGTIQIVAFRNNATTKININFTQTGHLTAGLSMPTSLLTHTSVAGTYTLPLNPVNQTTAEVVGNNAENGWVSNVNINADGVLSYDLAAYDGTHGGSREATITVKATNGHANAVFYYITVRQYTPESAGISIPTTLVTHNGFAVDGVVPVNPINNSTIEVVNVSETWVNNVTLGTDGLNYHVDAYNGAQGDTREAVITLKASNSHLNDAFYYITIRQYAPPVAGISMPTIPMVYNYMAQHSVVELNPLNDSEISIVSINADWVTQARIQDNLLIYDVKAYDGAEGPFREAVITLKAKNSHVNAAFYYLTIRQYEPNAAGISLPVQMIVHNFKAKNDPLAPATYLLNSLNGSVVTVVDENPTSWLHDVRVNGNTLEYLIEAYNGSEGEYRETVITLKASNPHANDAYFYITVRQYEPDVAAIDTPSQYITLGPDAITGYEVALNRLNDSQIEFVTTVYNHGTGWISAPIAGINKVDITNNTSDLGGKMTFNIAAYDGSDGDVREALIILKATNANYNSAYYYITIRQEAPAVAAISPVTSLITHQAPTVTGTLQLNPMNDLSSLTATVASAYSWVSGVGITGGVLSYTLAAYDGSQGAFRDAIIVITASNAHFNNAKYYITIRQYAPSEPAISPAVTLIHHDASAMTTNATLELNPLNDLTNLTATASSTYTWLSNVGITSGVLNYRLAAYDGAQGEYRDAIIVITASNAHFNDAKYYITIRQHAPNGAGMSEPVEMLVFSAAQQSGSLPLQPFLGSTIEQAVTVSQSGSWLTNAQVNSNLLTFDLAANTSTTSYRDAVLTITVKNATGDTKTYQLTVRQLPVNAPGINGTLPTYIGIGSNGQTGSLPFILAEGTTSLTIDSSTPAWTGANIAGNTLSYNVAAWTGTTATFMREGVIVVRASNGTAANDVLYYITVRQYGNQFATISPASLVFTQAAAGYTANFTITNGVSYSTPTVTWLRTGFTNNGCGTPNATETMFMSPSNISGSGFSITFGQFSETCTAHQFSRFGVIYVTLNGGVYTQTLTVNVEQRSEL